MATETSLNQLVKGAPPPGTNIPLPAPLPPLAKASSDTINAIPHTQQSQTDTSHGHTQPRPPLRAIPTIIQSHTEHLPSSPPQIYLNLLILESSLRAQYLSLLARRRLNSFFLLFLIVWNLTFTYLLLLRPREDGSGKLGGSPYWVVEALIRLGFIAGIVAALLVKATGQWETGVRWPRKWVGVTNRGLRGFNLRVVVVRRGWWRESISYVKALAPFGGIADGSGDWHWVESPVGTLAMASGLTGSAQENGKGESIIVEEDLSPSGDHLLLLLLPKNFSSEFRENWETYRSEYWGRENERRAGLRRKVAVNKRKKAKELGGWKWWTGLWRLIPHASHRRRHGDLEKHPHGHHAPVGHQRSESRVSQTGRNPLSEKDALAKASRRRSLMRSDSRETHSRQSSRSSTPHYMLDGTCDVVPADGKKERVRRGSSVSSTGSSRRSLRSGTGSLRRGENLLSPLTTTDEPGEIGKEKKKRRSRPSTPTVSSTESFTSDVQIKKESDGTTA